MSRYEIDDASPWLIYDRECDCHGVLIARDIDAIRDAILESHCVRSTKALRQQIARIVELLEFGVVETSGDDLLWKNGQFTTCNAV